jgi:hypothetical protein
LTCGSCSSTKKASTAGTSAWTAEGWIGPALRQPFGWGVRLHAQWIVEPLISPETRDRDDPAVELADRAQVLPSDVRGLGAGLPIAAVIDHQHPILVGRRRGIGHQ